MQDINDTHQFNMLPIPYQIKALRTTILQRLRIEEPTLRDQFAMAALKETAGELKDTHSPVEIAEWCYIMADAMLEARRLYGM